MAQKRVQKLDVLGHSKLGFLGAGNMATAMAKGFVAAGLNEHQVMASARTESTLNKFKKAVGDGIFVSTNNLKIAEESDILFLCVKPQYLMEVLREVASGVNLKDNVIIVSVVAGISLTALTSVLGERRLIRVMPNTPCLVLEGASAMCCSSAVTESDEALVKSLFDEIGICVKVPQEHLLEAVSGLSGSGPAYVLTMIQAMADGGVKMGLPRAVALELAAKTVKGAASLVLETGKHPGQLRDEIMSPAGTTAFGVHALEGCQGFRNSVINAVEAAATRAGQLKALGD